MLLHTGTPHIGLPLSAAFLHARNRDSVPQKVGRETRGWRICQILAAQEIHLHVVSHLFLNLSRRACPPPQVPSVDSLNEHPDVLLALAGKVSSDLQEIIKNRPALFGELIRELKQLPDNAVLRLVREVRDGDW